MSTIYAFTEQEITQRLGDSSLWCYKDKKLYRRFIFTNFVQAFGFMSQVALLAEKMDHHPEWTNVYKTVWVHLITHEVNGVSDRDFQLAAKIDNLI